MKPRIVAGVFVVAALAMSVAAAQVRSSDIGKREYESSCAVCHGVNGKGGGSFSQLLQFSMPDLTTLSKRNGGVFPAAHVYQIIDGRAEVKAHGTREMPIWGRHFNVQAAPQYDDYPWESEAFVRARILLLIDYLYRLQER